jgi:hypothetical protein
MTRLPDKYDDIQNSDLAALFNARSIATFNYSLNAVFTPLSLGVPTPFIAPTGGVNEALDRTNEWAATVIGTPGVAGSTVRYTFTRVGATGVYFRLSFGAEWRADANDKEIRFQVYQNGSPIGIPLVGNAHVDKPIIAGFTGTIIMNHLDYIELFATNIENNDDLLVPAFSLNVEETLV